MMKWGPWIRPLVAKRALVRYKHMCIETGIYVFDNCHKSVHTI